MARKHSKAASDRARDEAREYIRNLDVNKTFTPGSGSIGMAPASGKDARVEVEQVRAKVRFRLYDGREMVGEITVVETRSTGRKLRVVAGDLVFTIDAQQILERMT